MLYRFKCQEHGEFEVHQPLLADHIANCPACGADGERVYSLLQFVWAGALGTGKYVRGNIKGGEYV